MVRTQFPTPLSVAGNREKSIGFFLADKSDEVDAGHHTRKPGGCVTQNRLIIWRLFHLPATTSWLGLMLAGPVDTDQFRRRQLQ